MEKQELIRVIEVLLFAQGRSVPQGKLSQVIGVTEEEIASAVDELRELLDKDGHALIVNKVAGGYEMGTRPEYSSYIKKLFKEETTLTLSRSALETLAITAYNQPVTRAAIESVRGVDASGCLRTLMERKLVRIAGRKRAPGRPLVYATTEHFLRTFGLNDLSEMPRLEDAQE
jgi:segregation and condensation protein B